MHSPFQTDEIFHIASYNNQGDPFCILRRQKLRYQKKCISIYFSKDLLILSKQCRPWWNAPWFIWVFTGFQSTHVVVSRIQRVKYVITWIHLLAGHICSKGLHYLLTECSINHWGKKINVTQHMYHWKRARSTFKGRHIFWLKGYKETASFCSWADE